MQPLKLVCARCGTTLAPAFHGLRCPRLSACGRGGIVETIGFQPAWAFLGDRTGAKA